MKIFSLRTLLTFLLILILFQIVSAQSFITTWKTDNLNALSSNSTSITIPTYSGETYNYDVDWNNDGVFDEFGITGDVTHDFGTAGTYTIQIRGQFPMIYFYFNGDRDKILSVNQWGNQQWTSMYRAFAGCSNLVISATDVPNLLSVTNMSEMFFNASSFNQPVGDWDVSTVTDMSYMFSGATSFNQDISNWNTSSVTNMRQMFFRLTSFNQDISNWDVSSVTNMKEMFCEASSFNQNIGNWNVSSVIDMRSMFFDATAFNQDIGNWNVSNVSNMVLMFNGATTFNQDISNWDISAVTDMWGMFCDATSFNQNIGNWDVSSVTDMSYMFEHAISFNQDIGNWNVSSVRNMIFMFTRAIAFNQDIGNWDVSSVTDMSYMFEHAISFNQDIGSWNVQSVMKMRRMFSGAHTFNQNIGSWNIQSLSDATSMFYDVTLSTANYDALLIGWEANTHHHFVFFSGGNSQYCAGAIARSNLIYDNWSITDGGPAPRLDVDTLPDVSVCNTYALPTLTNGDYYTGTGGTGTQLNAGDNITSTQTIYIYATNGTCDNESSFDITINSAPVVDNLTNVSACDSYTLQALTNGTYYTGTGGTGTHLNAGDNITSTQTIYIYATNGTCDNESSFIVTINTAPSVDNLTNVSACDSYTLQALTNGTYYTGTGGTGTQLNAGDNITSTQTIYIYATNGTCDNESSFDITINSAPVVDNLTNVSACDSYTLQALTNGTYYTGTGGTGTQLNAGDNITSTQTIYIYANNGTCDNESSFDVTINATPAVDNLTDVSACDSYILQSLTNGDYYTGSGGTGTQLNAGDNITSTQTIYIYANNGSCDNESSFDVIIDISPSVDILNDVSVVNEYALPVLNTGDYYTESMGQGTELYPGDVIDESQTIYIYADNGNCFNESSFNVEINYELIIPKFFTPNADGFNDTWGIKHAKLLSDCDKIYIYNRFGKLVKIMNANIDAWDGTYNGKAMPASDYWFKLVTKNQIYTGHFALKR